MYFLGIDAGGSNCRARLVDRAGTVVGTGKTGPANTRIGIDALFATLEDVAGMAIAEAGLNASQIATISAAMGIAGISRLGARDQLAQRPFSFAPIKFETDAEIANLGANGGQDGAVLIIGTGSVAQVRHEGRSFSIGGYGFPISDEGSGAALGLSAMRHALRALDGRTRPTPLSSAVTARFGHEFPRAIEWMDQASPRDYGSLAPLVMDFAEANDEIAVAIVEDAARHIERFIDTVFARGVERCCLLGGLSSRIRPWLKSRTVERLAQPLGDALDGAVFLAGLRPFTATG
jgi:glucosamine kinase